jgi:hypothetical protein
MAAPSCLHSNPISILCFFFYLYHIAWCIIFQYIKHKRVVILIQIFSFLERGVDILGNFVV